MLSQSAKPKQNNKRLWIIASIVLLVVIAIFFAINAWLSHQMNRTEFTSSTAPLEIVVGNDVFRIPANHVRFEHQRNASAVDQLDLVFLFPDIAGYSSAQKAKFNATGNNSELVHITLKKRKLSFDMSNRLTPIYKQLFEGPAQNGPANLTLQPLRSGSGYNGEVLAIGETPQQKWVARCQTEESNMRPVCIRDVFVGRETSALYSFPLHMLEHWETIEKKTLEFLKNANY